jgi:septum formation protein
LAAFILASQSPRRRQLLTQHGIAHEARHPGIDDAQLQPGQVTPEMWTAALAYLKAMAAAAGMPPGGTWLVVGADTVCVKDGQLVGQPADEADARRILELLQDGEHDVVTGVALLQGNAWRHLFVDRARVRVGHIGEHRIQEYLASGEWKGKAGAYNLLERIEAGWPIEYSGDPTTIMGLPMRALLTRLAALEKRKQAMP